LRLAVQVAMNRTLPTYAIKHPIMTLMLVVTCVGLGVISWRLLPLEFTIKLDFPHLGCWIPYPGAAPEQVEKEVTIQAEGEFMTIPHLRTINSHSHGGGCYISLLFDWDADMSMATADLRDRVERLKLKLPQEIEHVFLRKFGSMDWPILRFALFREEEESELARLARTQIRSRLMRVEGVAEVEVTGRATEQVYVEFDQEALRSLNLSLYSVIGTLQRSSLNVTMGKMRDGASRYFVRALNELSDAEELRDVLVGPNSVRLKDIARVTVHGPSGADRYSMDGKKGTYVRVVKEAEANVVDTCEAVKAELARLMAEPDFDDVEMYIFEDKAAIIQFALSSLMKAGAYGCLLALCVLLVFLRRLRATVLVALATPLSLTAAFVYLYFSGHSLNLVSIAAMIVSLGMLVDNAIVVMENIYRHNELGPDKVQNAVNGASEVAMAITASTLTTIVVFIPVMYLDAGELSIGMRQFAGPVTVALLSSLVVALTVIPLTVCHMRPRRHHPAYRMYRRALASGGRGVERLAESASQSHPLKWIVSAYGRVVGLIIERRWHAMALLGLLIGLTILVPFRQVGVQQMPDLDMRVAQVRVDFERNYDGTMAAEVFDHLTAIIDSQREDLGIRNLYVDYGSWGGVIRAYLTQPSDLLRGERMEHTTDEVRQALADQLPDLVPGGRLSFGVGQAGPTDSQTISLTLRGEDAAVVADMAERFQDLVAGLPAVLEVTTDRETVQQEIQLHIDEPLARQAGLSPLVIARTVDFALRGIQLPYLKKDGREIPVRGQFGSEDRKTKANLANMAVLSHAGTLVPLSNIATMEKDYAPQGLRRENGKSVARITATVSSRDMTLLGAEIDELIASFELPRGYGIEKGQRINEIEATLRNYRQALVLALILIYLVMASLFESCLLPFSILTTVPMAFLGVYWSLYLTGTSMDTVAFIGVILMCGIVVNNGIVIVDHINQLRREGMTRHAAIVQAGRNRFRPVMMTALTTILGCVPLAIGTGRANDALNSLGRALVGGLVSGTLLTLLVVPLIYTVIDDAQGWLGRYVSALAHLGGRSKSATPWLRGK